MAGLGVTIQNAVLRFLNWAEEMFANTPQVMEWLNSLTFNWQSINWQSLINQVVDVVKSGATSILSSAFSTAMNVFNGVADTFIAFFFACYLLLQKEKLGLQCRKALYALLPRKGADQVVEVFSLSHRIFSSFITGQCTEAVILGTMFFIVMSILNMPYAVLVGCTIAVTALIPIVGAFHRLRPGGLPPADGLPHAGPDLRGHVPDFAAGGGQPDLPPRGGGPRWGCPPSGCWLPCPSAAASWGWRGCCSSSL